LRLENSPMSADAETLWIVRLGSIEIVCCVDWIEVWICVCLESTAVPPVVRL